MNRPRLLALLSLALSLSAHAGTITVMNANDSGAGSLREAVTTTAGSGDVVVFDSSLAGATITLTSGELAPKPNTAMTIDGGASRITISGNKTSRVFHVVTAGQLVTMKSLTIRDGHSGADGGAVLNAGWLEMDDCAVADSSAGASGGGISNSLTLTVKRSTISGNSAVVGGGISNGNGSATFTNSTVSGNVASIGGGIAGSVIILSFCTVTENLASGTGGGIDGSTAPTVISIGGSIVAGNFAPSGPDCNGVLGTSDYNVIGSVSGCSFSGSQVHHVTGVDARLGSLQFNGGKTRTHALLRGSPAIELFPPGPCSNVEDQRSNPRPRDGDADGFPSCDAGAYEAAHPIVVTSLADPGDGTTCTLRQALAAADVDGPIGTCAAGAGVSDAPDRIVFDVTGTIATTTIAALTAGESVLIEGPGADLLTVSGAAANRLFEFQDGANANTYAISGLTIANGRRDFGAGVYFFNAPDDTLAIDRVYFKDNVASSNGGSIYAQGVRGVEINRSTFTNTAAASNSASLHFNTTTALLKNTTIAETSSAYAVSVLTTSATVPANLRLVNCTLKGTETYGVGAISFAPAPVGSATAEYESTLSTGHFENFYSNGGTLTSRGYNVSSDGTGGLSATGDLPSTDPKLGALTFNGGPIPTFNTKLGSPAIAIAPQKGRATVDERGFLRHATSADGGALEHIPSGDVNGDGMVDVADVFFLINFLFASGPLPVNEGDVNADGVIDVADVFYLINTLFASGPAPA